MPITTPPTLDPAPNVPNSNDPETTFDSMFEAFFAYLRNTFVSTVNAIAAACFSNATSAQASATASAASAAASEASALASLAGSNFKGDWAALPVGPLNRPASVAHIGRTWLLLADLPNVAAAEPSNTSPYWRANDVVLPLVPVSTATATMLSGKEYSVDRNGQVTLTMPAPIEGAVVVITVTNKRNDTVLLHNGGLFEDEAALDDVTLIEPKRYALRFTNNAWRGFK